MNFRGEIEIDSSREAVFDRLQEEQLFASRIEGVHDLTEVNKYQYTAVFETKIVFNAKAKKMQQRFSCNIRAASQCEAKEGA